MRRCVDLTQSIRGDQRIDLGGGHGRVSQQLLNHPDVRPTLQEVGGEGMAQRVWRDIFGDIRLLGGGLKDGPRTLPADPATPGVEEQRRGGALALGRQQRPAANNIGPPDGAGTVRARGTRRSLEPLPNSRTMAGSPPVSSRETSSTSNPPTASLMRAPVE